jgi:dienelactone hydrolase
VEATHTRLTDSLAHAASPGLLTVAPRGPARGAVLLAHGGSEHGPARDSHLRPPALRMLPFLADIARAGRHRGIAVAQLRYRVVAFNDGDPVRDVRWALDRLRERFDAPACVIGHSMGARAALLAADHPAVVGVAGLASWVPPSDPVEQLAGRTVMLVHGLRDRVTDPRRSEAYALRAAALAERVCRFELAGARHAMLERPRVWHGLARRFALGVLGAEPLDARIAAAFALPPAEACRVLL